MNGPYASHFFEIPSVLAQNEPLRREVVRRVAGQPMPAKVLEGPGRPAALRRVLTDLLAPLQPPYTLDEAYLAAEAALPRAGCLHAQSNQVFAAGWAERLVRTELSVSYNQTVLELVLAAGESQVHVPPSPREDASSPCTLHLAGSTQDAETLLRLLLQSYRQGRWQTALKVPNHPHCTHVVVPLIALGSGYGAGAAGTVR
ncbi:MAG: hypothetical protein AB7O37_23340 [Vicinamibacteria bacterium]